MRDAGACIPVAYQPSAGREGAIEPRGPVTHFVTTSSGIGSWYAGIVVRERYFQPGDRLVLAFSDVLIEDPDNYRFLIESCDLIPDAELVWLVDGRHPFEVFRDDKFLGNTRMANCSKWLKQKPARDWLDANADPEHTVIYVGIDWTETHRIPDNRRGYSHPFGVGCKQVGGVHPCKSLWGRAGERHEGPACAHMLTTGWDVAFPLAEPPYVEKADMLAHARALGVEPPVMYEQGYEHANCGGGCVRAGAKQFVHLLTINPTRYAWWESEEEATRVHLGKDVAILRDRRGGTTKPLTLRQLRERHQTAPEQIDMLDTGTCNSCFSDVAS